MQYIEAPDPEKALHASVFLAGGISHCSDWQKDLVERLKDLPITVFNPRRKGKFLKNAHSDEIQIDWEFSHIREALVVAFWFSEGSPNPITLFEYGGALERSNQIVIVGIHPSYERRNDVEIQTKIRRPDIIIHYSLEEHCSQIRSIFV